MRNKTVDVNSLLQGANLVVAGLLVYALIAVPSNEYVDENTIALGLLLCLQTHAALLLERMRRDPFVILLAFEMIFYFSLRIFTLALVPYSLVFNRYAFGPDDSSYALVIVIIANVFLYAGLIAVRLGANQRVDSAAWRATSPRVVVALMLVMFALAYFSGDFWTVANLPRALTVVRVLLTPVITVSMALAYYLVFRESLTRRTAVAIAVLLVLEMAVHTLGGSRSAIVYFAQTCLLVALAVSGVVTVKRRYVVFGVAMLPVLAGLLVATFAISSYNRLNRQASGQVRSLDIASAVQSATEGGSDLVNRGIDVLVPPVLARAGYFDFSAEIIAHRDQYRSVMNATSYGKSIIDNVLTPGFDVFDQPPTANALRFVYLSRGAPSKRAVDEEYHSDQLGIYGELYALFGYACFPLFFVLPYLLKRLYGRLRAANPFSLAMQRVVLLVVFVKSLESFGFDWTIADMVPFVLGIAMISVFFSSRRAARANIGQPASPRALAIP